MSSIVRWLFLFIAALVLSVLIEPLFVGPLESVGWYEKPFQVLYNWMTALMGAPAFRLVAAGALGASAGVWLHWLATRVDSKRLSKSDEFADLSMRIENLQNEIYDFLKTQVGDADFNSRNRPIELSRKALYAELKKLGLRPPQADSESNMESYVGHYHYLQTLLPFAQSANLAEAKREEKKSKAEFEDAMRELRETKNIRL